MGLRIGADIGGTFTDVAAEDEATRWSVKVPTTHGSPEEGVLDAVRRVLVSADRTMADIELLVHGTTLATNALIERKVARTALLTTAGFRDVLEMGNEGRFDQYDLRATKPRPLVPRHMRFVVKERLRHDGHVIETLDLEELATVAQRMREAAVEAVAITFLHAYANDAHERQARDLLALALPGVPISVSHEVSPEMREYQRTSTTVANACLQPIISGYLLRLQDALRRDGLRGPMLMILSSGSLTTVEIASRFPIRLLESGPAGGAIFASDISRRLAVRNVLSFDVGGTTAKFCMIDGGEARQALNFEVARTYRFKKGSGLPVRVPVVDLVEIGAGGGSIARLDSVGRVAIGPDSAGSEPGPACYARGGTNPTVTDSDLVLGKLDAPSFAAGTMPLDVPAAKAALSASFGFVGFSPEDAAYGVTETVTESMAAAARVHAAETGAVLEDRTIIAFGGAAPLHAARFAEKLGIGTVIVPEGAGVGSAIGFLRAPVAFEVVRTLRAVLTDALAPELLSHLSSMEAQARDTVLSVPGSVVERLEVRRSTFMRYAGQGHEIEVVWTAPLDTADLGRILRETFEREYTKTYGRKLESAPVETTSWVVRVVIAQPGVPGAIVEVTTHTPRPTGSRRIYAGEDGTWSDWVEYERSGLQPGACAAGPAVICEAETTTIVPPIFSFSMDSHRFLWLTRNGGTP